MVEHEQEAYILQGQTYKAVHFSEYFAAHTIIDGSRPCAHTTDGIVPPSARSSCTDE